jgi:excisionase family DNA binding protein
MENRVMSRQKAAAPASLRAAAVRIGVSLPTLYKLIGRGKLRTYHVGRAHRVSEEAVRDCIVLLEQESRGSPVAKTSSTDKSPARCKDVVASESKRGS